MKLINAQITEFKSVRDSTTFPITDITCLVGKNEAGKTAIIEALYRLNPILPKAGNFDVTDDYPRRDVADYQDDVEEGKRTPANVVTAMFRLEREDLDLVVERFGAKCLKGSDPVVSLSKGYDNKRTFGQLWVDEKAALQFVAKNSNLPSEIAAELAEQEDVAGMLAVLANGEQTAAVKEVTPTLQAIKEYGLRHYIYNEILSDRVPKFMYFADYYQLTGQDNVNALKQRRAEDNLDNSDHPLLGLLALARLDLDELTDPRRTEALISKLEAAENQLTDKVLKYWSQNRHLRMSFDIRPAQPEDPEGMRSGMNIWGRVKDTKHGVSTPLGSRSRGFVWFFSFLAWYSQVRKEEKNLVLLLDEPGLSLHAKGQQDLLRYIEEELGPDHQVIYTTHSPFMVESARFERVRIVQDLSIEADSESLPEHLQGTRVIEEVLEATEDTLFPLQGALGYEIYQTLFIGPNCLVVEGVSDFLFLQGMSAILQGRGEAGLDWRWTITPVGGASKVPTFVALIGAQSKLNLAVLIDYQKRDQQEIENLYKRKLLNKKRVLTYADFVSASEADIEDMFNPGTYLKLVNAEFGTSIAVGDLPSGPPRIVTRLEAYLESNPLPNNAVFNHYRPARYFNESITSLEGDLTEPQLNRFRDVFNRLNSLIS